VFWNAFGFGWKSHADSIIRTWQFAVPHWFLVLLLAAMPAWWVLRWRRERESRRRAERGLCLHCGYDLRATPQRCPECGVEAGEGSSV
jgi:hypothetical protein